jgi:sugar lactone lactonase YvrE
VTLPAPSIGRRRLLRGSAAAMALALPGCAGGERLRKLEPVATFTDPHQVTGVAVTPSGRVFVNFPRWEQDVSVSVAEIAEGGILAPYPDQPWNDYRAAADNGADRRFVCVQSVTADPRGNVWVVDAGAPNMALLVPGAPKLVCIDTVRNRVVRVYPIDRTIAPQGTYLNDIRFTPDGTRAVLTNSGEPGCLIALDVVTGQARRVLEGHPSTQIEPGFVVTVNGRALRRTNGQTAQFAADGIAIDRNGEYVYWQATTGSTMYRVPVAALFDARMPPSQLGDLVQVRAKTFLADGYWMSQDGTLFLTSCADNAVRAMTPDGTFSVVARDPRLNWPDSLAGSADGWIYVTASHIPEMQAWQGSGVSRSELFRFRAV